MKLFFTVLLLVGARVFAGTPSQDPVVNRIYLDFVNGHLPSSIDLKLGTDINCTYFESAKNAFRVEDVDGYLKLETYNGGLIRNLSSRSYVKILAPSETQLSGTFSVHTQGEDPIFTEAIRVSDKGALIIERSVDPSSVGANWNFDRLTPSIGRPGNYTGGYFLCPR